MTYADALLTLAGLYGAVFIACVYTLATEHRKTPPDTYWLGREPITRADYRAISQQRAMDEVSR